MLDRCFLVALRMKSESIDEVVGAVTVMRELATGVSIKAENAVDIVGTGGDGANLFISTRHRLLSRRLVAQLQNTVTAGFLQNRQCGSVKPQGST